MCVEGPSAKWGSGQGGGRGGSQGDSHGIMYGVDVCMSCLIGGYTYGLGSVLYQSTSMLKVAPY